MRTGIGGTAIALGILLASSLPACVRGARRAAAPGSTAARSSAALGPGASPGNERGPGGFVPRGAAKNFYAAAGGRLWYYVNNYYWAPATAREPGTWLKAEVVERFADLRRWPDEAPLDPPEPKVTVEYWLVGASGRTVEIDNHKDFLLRSDDYGAGAIEVSVTLTLGRVEVRDAKGVWGKPTASYVLERRNYGDDRGVGEDRTRFVPRETEPVTVWGYRVPWRTFPARLTRSNWEGLELPAWSLVERRPLETARKPRVATTAEGEEPSPDRR
jgi:hypothetical protein